MIEDFYVSFVEIKREIKDILRSKGNYVAKVTLTLFGLIVMIIGLMTCMSIRDCLNGLPEEKFDYKEIKRKRTEREE